VTARQPHNEEEKAMGHVKASVILQNAREVVLARLGHLPADQVHTYVTEALIDTGATRSTLPPFVADQLGLVRLGRTEAQMADGRFVEVEVTEPLWLEILGRQTSVSALVLGDQVLLGVTVLEELDLLVDCRRQQVIPHPAHPDQPVFRV
jgi:clan AA aspartic protease